MGLRVWGAPLRAPDEALGGEVRGARHHGAGHLHAACYGDRRRR